MVARHAASCCCGVSGAFAGSIRSQTLLCARLHSSRGPDHAVRIWSSVGLALAGPFGHLLDHGERAVAGVDGLVRDRRAVRLVHQEGVKVAGVELHAASSPESDTSPQASWMSSAEMASRPCVRAFIQARANIRLNA